MSSDEKAEPREEDVEAHRHVTEELGDENSDRDRKRKQTEDLPEFEGDEFGRRRK
jgi:hypothetical protein